MTVVVIVTFNSDIHMYIHSHVSSGAGGRARQRGCGMPGQARPGHASVRSSQRGV